MATNHDNPPTLTAITYRVDTHPTLLARMIERLHQQRVAADAARPLAALTTRDPDDPALALLDAWAVVGDVLTFYQERIANEGYLLTATEPRSRHELARTTGYELRPGLAATVALAFTVATVPGMDAVVQIEAGVKVQSIPGQDQQPQTFETVEAIAARPEWNSLNLASSTGAAATPLPSAATAVRLAGTSTGLQPGDPILIVGAQPEQRYLRTVQKVAPDPQGNFTNVTWDQALALATTDRLTAPQLFAFRQRASLFGHVGWNGIVRYRPNGGWEPLPRALSTRAITALLFYRQGQTDYLFAGTAGTGIFRSTDNGESWQPCNAGLANLMVHALCAPVVNGRPLLYAGTTEGAIFCSINDGDSWAQLSSGSLIEHTKPIYLSITPDPTDSKKTVSKEISKPGDLIKEYEKWESINGLPRTTIHALVGYIKDTVFHLVATTAEGLYESTDNGARWSKLERTTRVWALARGRLDGQTEHLFGAGGNALYVDDVQQVSSLKGMRTLTIAGNTLWIGTDQGIWQWNGSSVNSLNPNLPNRVQALAVGSDGFIFAAVPLAPSPGWPALAISKDRMHLDLDALYNTLEPNAWMALVDPAQANSAYAYQVAAIETTTPVTLTPTPSVTRLTLAANEWLPDFAGMPPRTFGVLAQSEPLTLFSEPQTLSGLPGAGVGELAGGRHLILAGKLPPLNAGRRLIVSGKPPDAGESDPLIGEVVLVESTQVIGEQTLLTLQSPGLQKRYAPATVTIYANVAQATHGETIVAEVLGSGDGAQVNQRFILKHAPLTYVPAPTTSGAASTLTVRVNEVTWTEAPSLHALQPRSQHYMVRQDAAGRTALVFGNGQQGARLPSGAENVVATYRTGLGPAGNVNAESLTLLQTRPLGVQEVLNPLAASGGTAPEPGDLACQNAPRRVLTMDRLVALADFEDFTRTFAGIELAQATLLWIPGARPVHLTIAGSNGGAVAAGSGLYQALTTAIDQRRKATQPVIIASYTAVHFALRARLYLAAHYAPAAVAAAVRAALLAAFQFKERTFGQDVAPSQVITVIQATPGVVAVNLLALQPQAQTSASAPAVLRAQLARWDAEQQRTQPAELLVLDENDIMLEDANGTPLETGTTL